MKLSLNWLSDYVNVSHLKAADLADLLTRIGLSIEETIETDSDIVLDVEVTNNRPDCLGVLGLAREIAAALGADFRAPAIGELPTALPAVAQQAGVEVREAALCPRYTARLLRNVKIGPSPRWLVERLQAVGMRSINNVVDVTNYVLMEYSQPLHSFDYDKLAGHKIIVRRAADGETLVAIDQTRCKLDSGMLVIADAEKPVAIAGVMGGLDTEVTAGTVNVLLESAVFDPLTIRRASRKLQLMSDSNYRFERGVDPVGVEIASRRACQLILDLAGGELAPGVLDVWATPHTPRSVALRPQRTSALLGLDVPADRQMQILSALGLSPVPEGGTIRCVIPSWRGDLSREVDLIEEVARHVGLDAIAVSDRVAHAVAPEALPQRARRQVGAVLTACGLSETMTATFIDAQEAELLGPGGAPVAVDPLVRKTNNILRGTLIPSLLRVIKTNQDAGGSDVGFYELTSVLPPARSGSGPDEFIEVGLATTRDLRELRGALEALLASFDPHAGLEVRPGASIGLDPAASGEVYFDGEKVGRIGLVAAHVLDYYGIERPVAAAAIRFDALLKRAGGKRVYSPLAKFPAVTRDLSVVVDEDVTWTKLASAIAGVAQPMRTDLQYVTTYRGKQIASGRKSVTVTLTYRSSEGTLRSQQVDEQVAQVVEALKSKLNAELRA